MGSGSPGHAASHGSFWWEMVNQSRWEPRGSVVVDPLGKQSSAGLLAAFPTLRNASFDENASF